MHTDDIDAWNNLFKDAEAYCMCEALEDQQNEVLILKEEIVNLYNRIESLEGLIEVYRHSGLWRPEYKEY
jgi:hypothetical protein